MKYIAKLAMGVAAFSLTSCAYDKQNAASVSDGSNAISLSRPAADIVGALEKSGRSADDIRLDESRQPLLVLNFMKLKSGHTVLDIFAGGGYYSEIMARAVGPTGKVVAHNAGTFGTDDAGKAKWKALQERNGNLELLRAGFNEWRPEANSYDFAMSHLVFHDIYFESERFGLPRVDAPAYLAQLHNAMKPGGVVAIVDHVGPPGDVREVAAKLHRIDPERVKSDMLGAGFVLEAESDLLKNTTDDVNKLVFDPSVRGKTSRMVMRFRKPG